ncbi:MAG: hypothetical protein FJ098_10345, partial [Deltaproteobacteria bacterium]|nr:hypothetical protein [Deltaproteobacteria bacterium]
GIEKTFRRIAPELNGGIPAGDAWHRRLLDSMAMEIAEVRPAVIGRDTLRRLDEYLRFRHLFRNVYGFELEQDRVLELCRGMAGVWTVVEADLGRFMRFLRQLAAAGASTTRTVPRP